MTNRTKLVLVTVGATLGGGFVGAVAAGYTAMFFSSYLTDGWMLKNSVETQTNVGILKNLRDGDTEKAIELLETTLDGKVISLQISVENTDRTNEAVAKAIQMVREYRADYPRKTHFPEVDEMVQEVLNQNTK